MISEFKGQQMVSIREYYEKDGQALPGKKVSLVVRLPYGLYCISPW